MASTLCFYRATSANERLTRKRTHRDIFLAPQLTIVEIAYACTLKRARKHPFPAMSPGNMCHPYSLRLRSRRPLRPLRVGKLASPPVRPGTSGTSRPGGEGGGESQDDDGDLDLTWVGSSGALTASTPPAVRPRRRKSRAGDRSGGGGIYSPHPVRTPAAVAAAAAAAAAMVAVATTVPRRRCRR